MCKETDLVQLMFGEQGLVIAVNERPWASTYDILVTKSDGVFNEVGIIISPLQKDIKLIKKGGYDV